MQTKTAMILAAGKGTRMRPFTDLIPKPLLPIDEVPLLERTVRWLDRFGFERIVINAFYLGDKIQTHLSGLATELKAELIVIQEPELLGTGGGIQHASKYWTESAWIVNGDVVMDFDFDKFDQQVQSTDATLVLTPHDQAVKKGPIYLGRGTELHSPVLGILQEPTTPAIPFLYTGLQWMTKALANTLPEQGCVIRDGYIHWLEHKKIFGLIHNGYWNEIGTPDGYEEIQTNYQNNQLNWLRTTAT